MNATLCRLLKNLRLLLPGGMAALVVAVAVHAAEMTGTAEKFEVPDYDAAGNLRWKLVGDRGQLAADGTVTVINARAELYESNRVTGVFSAPHCVLNRSTGSAKTDGPIRLERDNLIVTGIGGEWDTKTSRVLIHSNVQLVVQNVIVEKKQ
jgi:lipopolysaccharide export system protein LptC